MLDATTELLKLAINILNTARTTVETPQLQFVDGDVDVPVTTQRQDPTCSRDQTTSTGTVISTFVCTVQALDSRRTS